MPFQPVKPEAFTCACGATAFARTSLWGVTIVDADNLHLLQTYKWSAKTNHRGCTHYVASPNYGKNTGKSYYLHHAATGHIYTKLDHKNGDGHDNRRSNLRSCDEKNNSEIE